MWGSYISASMEQIRLDRQAYFVAVEQEGGALSALQQALERARLTANCIRERIREHEQSHRVFDTA